MTAVLRHIPKIKQEQYILKLPNFYLLFQLWYCCLCNTVAMSWKILFPKKYSMSVMIKGIEKYHLRSKLLFLRRYYAARNFIPCTNILERDLWVSHINQESHLLPQKTICILLNIHHLNIFSLSAFLHPLIMCDSWSEDLWKRVEMSNTHGTAQGHSSGPGDRE